MAKYELTGTDLEWYNQLKRLNKLWPGQFMNAETMKKDKIKLMKELDNITKKGGNTKNGRKTKHRKLG